MIKLWKIVTIIFVAVLCLSSVKAYNMLSEFRFSTDPVADNIIRLDNSEVTCYLYTSLIGTELECKWKEPKIDITPVHTDCDNTWCFSSLQTYE